MTKSMIASMQTIKLITPFNRQFIVHTGTQRPTQNPNPDIDRLRNKSASVCSVVLRDDKADSSKIKHKKGWMRQQSSSIRSLKT